MRGARSGARWGRGSAVIQYLMMAALIVAVFLSLRGPGKLIDETARGLGVDGDAYRRVVGAVAADWEKLIAPILGPPLRIPRVI